MGNRGCLHRGSSIVRHHRGQRWIICDTTYKDWRAPQWMDGRYTVLFFHDEAVALAAGHRPCALCRRGAFEAYRAPLGRPAAPALDARLHDERWDGDGQRHHARPWADLPTGAFVLLEHEPALVRADAVIPWTPSGYGHARERPRRGEASVITPPASLEVLASGYPVQIAAQVHAPVSTGVRPAVRTRDATVEERRA
ncbi:MAG: hypothetical protein QOE35_496 [Actinomycetota bacterium]|jgi:hypothetical protein